MPWGQRTADRRAERIATGSGRMFIKTFRDNETKIRVLWDDPGNNWIEYKEHYDKAANISYPCAKLADLPHCAGCEFPLPDNHVEDPGTDEEGKAKKCKCAGCQVRDRMSRWAFPALDEKGYLNIYKVGVRFWQQWKGKFELFGTIINCDYAVMKTGDNFNNTQYDAVPLPGTDNPREAKMQVPDINRMLRNSYLEALQKYGLSPTEMGVDEAAAGPVEPQEKLPDEPEPQPDAVPDDGSGDTDDHGPDPEQVEAPPASLQSGDELRKALTDTSTPFPADATDEQLRMLYDTFVVPKLKAATAATGNGQAPAAETRTETAPAGPAEPAAPADAANGDGEKPIDFKSWTTPDIRDWLTDPIRKGGAQEVSGREPRSVLITRAEKQLTLEAAG